jgi:hypothetical protein
MRDRSSARIAVISRLRTISLKVYLVPCSPRIRTDDLVLGDLAACHQASFADGGRAEASAGLAFLMEGYALTCGLTDVGRNGQVYLSLLISHSATSSVGSG